MTWYDGDQRPPREVLDLLGTVRAAGPGIDLHRHQGRDAAAARRHAAPAAGEDFAASRCRTTGRRTTTSSSSTRARQREASTPFDYSGPLTEAVLLGWLATRFPKTTLEWDAAKLKFRNAPEANAFRRQEVSLRLECQGAVSTALERGENIRAGSKHVSGIVAGLSGDERLPVIAECHCQSRAIAPAC